jgi:hypothetical protein
MSVYVDPIVEYGGSATFRWTKSCHMYADTEKELHKMAAKIGLKRSWFQDKGTSLKHYDLIASKRFLAVQNGAVEHSLKQMVAFMRKQREDGNRNSSRKSRSS